MKQFLHKIRIPLPSERGVFLVCMVVSFFFWLLLKMTKDYTTVRSFRLEYALPEGKIFSAQPPADLNATIRGRGWDLLFLQLFQPPPVLQIDLNQNNIESLSGSQIRSRLAGEWTPGNITIESVDQDLLDLRLEDAEVVTVPVRFSGSYSFHPAVGLKEPLRLTPDSVTITGPVTQVKGLKDWPTIEKDFPKIRTSISEEINLASAPQELILSPKKVTLVIPVEEFTEKSFYVPITVLNRSDSVKLFPQTVMVTVAVGLSKYNALRQSDFAVAADLRQTTQENGKTIVPLQLTQSPPETRSVRLSQQSAEYIIVK